MLIQIGYDEQLDISSFSSFEELIEELNDLLGENTYVIENNGKKIDLSNQCQLIDEEIYRIWPKVLGGKGGFGSLLRSFGKQILISKNKEACRDLNGRRMRDVNNEKKLKEWMQKQLEKSATPTNEDKSKPSSSHEEKKDYRNVPPPHKFSDAAYDEQKKQIADDMDEAVQIAAELIQAEKNKKKKQSSTAVSTNDVDDDYDEEVTPPITTTKKRRHSEDKLEDGELKNKKPKSIKGPNAAFFVGIDLGDISDDDDDEEEEKTTHQNDAKKKKIAKKL